MVEEQSSRFAGRAKILEPGEKVDAGEYTLEDYMQQIEAIPSNKRLLRQIGVRESVMRVRTGSIRTAASMCPFFFARAPEAKRCRVADFARSQCLSAKARHLAEYEMKDPRVMAIIVSLMGWEMKERPTSDITSMPNITP